MTVNLRRKGHFSLDGTCVCVCVTRDFHVTTVRGLGDRDSNLDLPVIGSLVYCESSALDYSATETGLPMCMSKRVCAALHVIWSLVYVGTGSIQLIAGIFFLISLPVFRVGSNIWTGAWVSFNLSVQWTVGILGESFNLSVQWTLGILGESFNLSVQWTVGILGESFNLFVQWTNIVVGIGGGMLSCVGDLNAKKQEALLFFTISILALNVVNIVILEVGEWHYFLTDTTREFLSQKNVKKLVFYGSVHTHTTFSCWNHNRLAAWSNALLSQ
ncbi:unnamed protein product [Timema podura]|uniref:Uncharacterized protein n=1 Tax=Timema podura TaxID=61482 RepID=A0ABN7P7U9_TIMPD|nr:unnamed protein product [Timema podura]